MPHVTFRCGITIVRSLAHLVLFFFFFFSPFALAHTQKTEKESHNIISNDNPHLFVFSTTPIG